MAAEKRFTQTLPFRADGLIVLALYLLVCLALGVVGWLKRRNLREDSMQDHFLAGKQGLPMPVLLGTLFAQVATTTGPKGGAMGVPLQPHHKCE